MLFDELIGVAERHLPLLRPKCRKARIFRFERETNQAQYHEAAIDWDLDAKLVENIRLPFDVVVFEEAEHRDSRGRYAGMFWNEVAESRQFGFAVIEKPTRPGDASRIAHGSLRAFPTGEFNPMGKSALWGEGLSFTWGEYVNKRWTSIPSDPAALARLLRRPMDELIAGEEGDAQEQQYQAEISAIVADCPEFAPMRELEDDPVKHRSLAQGFAKSKEPKIIEAVRRMREALVRRMNWSHESVLWGDVMLGLLSLMVVNTPAKFIVEESPLHPIAPRPGQIPRSPSRPHYIVLEPTEIRRRLLMPNVVVPADGEPPIPGMGRVPHERRGHWRTYTSERYRAARGQRRWIEACWIGPREAVVGQNRYLVRLDV